MTQVSTVDAPQGTDAAPRPNGVVVTGAARGLGKAIAAGFARDGAVVVGVDLDVSVETTMDELGPGHAGLVGDVADPAVLEAAFRTAATAGGGLATLVVNAGVTAPGETADYPVEQWDRILGVNLRAAFLGAKAAYPAIKTLNGYSQDFVDQAKCKEIALNQIAQGSKVVFQVAGQCGLGALDAAKEKGVQGIGVDADQSYLGAHILTSAIKKVDVAVYDAIKRSQAGKFAGGTDVIATVKNGGVGIGKISAAGQKYADQVKQIQDKIASGEIADIPDTVK